MAPIRLRDPVLLATPVLVVTAACRPEPPGPVRDASPVQTDSTVYHLERRAGPAGGTAYLGTARATYTNRTGAPVRFARCNDGDEGPMYGRRRAGPDSARPLFSDEVWACVSGVPPGRIAPGERVTVVVRLGALPQPRMDPPLREADITGRMRIVLALCAPPAAAPAPAPPAATGACEPLAAAARQSNAFDVRR